MTQAEMFMDEVMYQIYIHVASNRVRQLPSSLSDRSPDHSFLEVIATDDQIKRTITLSKLIELSGFKHCWKQLR